MKVLVLGGAGDMGSYVVRDLVKHGEVFDQITIGDVNQKAANKLLEELGDSRLVHHVINVLDHSKLVELMKEHDIVISTVGPFYIHGPQVVKAAIEAKVRAIIDICDDHGPTEEILGLDEEAKRNGVLVLVGHGWTPGLSNLLVRYGYDKLDKDGNIRVNISWAGGAADSKGFAVILHVLYAVTGKIPTFLDGKLVMVPAGGAYQKVQFPEPIGTVTVYDVGHPEPLTIPRYLDGIRECTLKGGLTPDWNNKLATALKHLHLIQGKKRQQIIAKFIHLTEKIFATGGVPASSARVDLFGNKDGKPVHFVYSTPSIHMGLLTGIPASIAAQLVANGKITGSGVKPPEAIENPSVFFDELKKRGIEMIFDDAGEPKRFSPLQSYNPSFLAKYGLTLLIIVLFLLLTGGILWSILEFLSF